MPDAPRVPVVALRLADGTRLRCGGVLGLHAELAHQVRDQAHYAVVPIAVNRAATRGTGTSRARPRALAARAPSAQRAYKLTTVPGKESVISADLIGRDFT